MQLTRLEAFRRQMEEEEKSPNTISKYLHDVSDFLRFQAERKQGKRTGNTDFPYEESMAFSHEDIIAYKKYLQGRYQISTVNSMLNALNAYLKFTGHQELCAKMLKQQRKLFCDDRKLLRRKDYRLLVEEAEREGKMRLSCILQTLGMTGIRIGELNYVTCEALADNVIHIDHKGKIRDIVIPRELAVLLKNFCREQAITSGPVFITRTGTPVDRKNVWREMKLLCERAGVNAMKVFPHNFRHLFAVAFYEKTKDIVRLADYLGHSSLETTRRYTAISTMEACQRELDLGLLVTRLLQGRKAGKSRSRQQGRKFCKTKKLRMKRNRGF